MRLSSATAARTGSGGLTNSDSHIIVCDSCYDRHYTTCTECGRILYYDAAYYSDEDDEDAPYCRSCAAQFASRSHQTSTCGLHVHVNRDSLGDTPAQQEDTIARILFFVENNWNELLKFSRRTVSQMQQWAARYGRKDSPKEVMETAKNKCYSRYSCVNLLNHSTIEFM